MFYIYIHRLSPFDFCRKTFFFFLSSPVIWVFGFLSNQLALYITSVIITNRLKSRRWKQNAPLRMPGSRLKALPVTIVYSVISVAIFLVEQMKMTLALVLRHLPQPMQLKGSGLTGAPTTTVLRNIHTLQLWSNMIQVKRKRLRNLAYLKIFFFHYGMSWYSLPSSILRVCQGSAMVILYL